MESRKKGTPNWLLFLFFGSLFFGGLYSIFLHGFLDYDLKHSYRIAAGSLYAVPELSIVPIRSADRIRNGETNFQRVCAACHGAYGQYQTGLVGPNLADGQWLHNDEESKIFHLIIKGIDASKSITGQVMSSRGGSNLSDENLWEVIYYLSSKNSSITQDAVPTE